MNEKMKPIFGDEDAIVKQREYQRVMFGKESFYVIKWIPCCYYGKHTDTGKPKFKYVDIKEADAFVDFIPCPKCGRLHCLLITCEPGYNHYDKLLQVDTHLESNGFTCWNCKTEFEVDELRNVFVKTDKA